MASIDKAVELLQKLQQVVEEATEGRCDDIACAPLGEGHYLRICSLTCDIHAALVETKAACTSAGPRSDAIGGQWGVDDGDVLEHRVRYAPRRNIVVGTTRIQRLRKLRDGTVVVEERGSQV